MQIYCNQTNEMNLSILSSDVTTLHNKLHCKQSLYLNVIQVQESKSCLRNNSTDQKKSVPIVKISRLIIREFLSTNLSSASIREGEGGRKWNFSFLKSCCTLKLNQQNRNRSKLNVKQDQSLLNLSQRHFVQSCKTERWTLKHRQPWPLGSEIMEAVRNVAAENRQDGVLRKSSSHYSKSNPAFFFSNTARNPVSPPSFLHLPIQLLLCLLGRLSGVK